MGHLTVEDLLNRLEWRRELRNLMGRMSHDYAVKQEGEVYTRYFSRRDDVCLGLNNGWYQGAEAVKGYYAALKEEIRLSSRLIQQMFPEELGGKTDEEVFGVGMMTYLPFESQVIEIADDGQTAKGIWNIRGSESKLEPCGPVAYWTFGWAAVDFVLEEGEWKIWHLQLLYNVHHQSGTGFCDAPKVFEPVEGFAPMADFKLPEPNVPQTLMETFRADRPKAQSPACPVPYATFSETFSYGV
jgi:hypothetical protein